MSAGIVVNVTRTDRRQLEANISDRSAPQKHVWRAAINLATADGCGTAEIMRRSGESKPVGWRWQARFMADARQNAQARQKTAFGRHCAEGCCPCAGTAAGESNPLDRPDAGEGGGREPGFNSADP
jgi:hypothetical protein